MSPQLLSKCKTGRPAKRPGNRLLITVTIRGSPGHFRFIVFGDQPAAAVISIALKSYAHEGRLPVLGNDLDGFLLYRSNNLSDAVDTSETIGSLGSRDFVLCKKPDVAPLSSVSTPKGRMGWKGWINKSLGVFKIYCL